MTEETAVEYAHTVAELAAAMTTYPGDDGNSRATGGGDTVRGPRRALEAGEPVDEIVDALILPLIEKAVPEGQATLDALLSLPDDRPPVPGQRSVLPMYGYLERAAPSSRARRPIFDGSARSPCETAS